MAKGGPRPGSGRPRKDGQPPGSPYKRKSRAKAPGDLKAKRPRAASESPEAGFTDPAGAKAEGSPKNWPFGTSAAETPPVATEKPTEAPEAPSDDPEISAETPLDLLLAIVREKRLKLPLRLQAAALAAPFVHAKPAPAGKKAGQADAAKAVSAGKFAASAPPLALVKRGR